MPMLLGSPKSTGGGLSKAGDTAATAGLLGVGLSALAFLGWKGRKIIDVKKKNNNNNDKLGVFVWLRAVWVGVVTVCVQKN